MQQTGNKQPFPVENIALLGKQAGDNAGKHTMLPEQFHVQQLVRDLVENLECRGGQYQASQIIFTDNANGTRYQFNLMREIVVGTVNNAQDARSQ